MKITLINYQRILHWIFFNSVEGWNIILLCDESNPSFIACLQLQLILSDINMFGDALLTLLPMTPRRNKQQFNAEPQNNLLESVKLLLVCASNAIISSFPALDASCYKDEQMITLRITVEDLECH